MLFTSEPYKTEIYFSFLYNFVFPGVNAVFWFLF